MFHNEYKKGMAHDYLKSFYSYTNDYWNFQSCDYACSINNIIFVWCHIIFPSQFTVWNLRSCLTGTSEPSINLETRDIILLYGTISWHTKQFLDNFGKIENVKFLVGATWSRLENARSQMPIPSRWWWFGSLHAFDTVLLFVTFVLLGDFAVVFTPSTLELKSWEC